LLLCFGGVALGVRSADAERRGRGTVGGAVAPAVGLTVDRNDLSTAGRWWECPCGSDPPKRPSAPTPVQTVISLREPRCPFCSRQYLEEYERRVPAP
jgi:hypothetical protein